MECRQLEQVEQTNIPHVRTTELNTVWFQVGGTICNLRCHHCFISCAPDNDKFGFMSLAACRRFLEEAKQLGVQEFYFTGGESFANPEMCDILEAALPLGDCTVLTNGTLFRPPILDRLESMQVRFKRTLELRVSIDGFSPAMNDPIRGEGTFDRAMDGVRLLLTRGIQPILTIARTWDDDDDAVLKRFKALLAGIGYEKPRLKILPLLKIGAEVSRGGGYPDCARVTTEMMTGFDENQLVCKSARLVTDQGVWVCPILPDFPEAKMGTTLAETIRDVPLAFQACHTCWQHGAICSNQTGCTE